MRLDENLIQDLSFNDFEIKEIEFFPKAKQLKIYLEGAILKTHPLKELGPGFISFKNWSTCSVYLYKFPEKQWTKLNSFEIQTLKEVCEFNFSKEKVELKGFSSKYKNWIECKIEDAETEAEF